jgi:hypothetical protein
MRFQKMESYEIRTMLTDAGTDSGGRDTVFPNSLFKDRFGTVTSEVIITPWFDQATDFFRFEVAL